MISPGFLQAVEEKIGAAEQQDLRQRRIAAGQRRQVLIDHSLKQRGNDFFHRHSRLQQRVGVGFGEDAALAADLVQRMSRVSHLGERLGSNFKLAGCLLDERTGPPRAGALHQHLFAARGSFALKENGLHVLAANFADEADIRMKLVHRGCDRNHLLHRLAADQWRNDARAGTGEEHTVAARGKPVLRFQHGQELKNLFGLASVVAFVRLG